MTTVAAVITANKDGQPAPRTLSLNSNEESERAGRRLLELIAQACNAEKLVYEYIAILRYLFDSITPRVPEFHALMNELVVTSPAKARRIMREPGSPGRPRDSLYFVAIMSDLIANDPELTQRDAATEILSFARGVVEIPASSPETQPTKTTLPSIPTTHALETRYSTLKELYALWSQPLHVPAALLTQHAWRMPESVLAFPAETRVTRSAHLIVIGPADVDVTIGECNVQSIASSPEQSSEPDEPEQRGVSEQSPRKR